MKPALVDVPVLILFFNRPQQLSQVFEQVKKARPSRLFLYQDGARNEHDLPGIKACREIVSQIDWECEVERFYQEKNFGCDPSEYISQKWAFSKVDKCIVLEDDDVPSVSFFRFCKEMLDKYEHDTRISMIAGFNLSKYSTSFTFTNLWLFGSNIPILLFLSSSSESISKNSISVPNTFGTAICISFLSFRLNRYFIISFVSVSVPYDT